MEYILSLFNDLSSCSINEEAIEFGKEFLNAYDILSSNDFDTFISDTITHEFIHSILMKTFDITASKLFDTIAYLIGNFSIKYQVFRDMQIFNEDIFPRTWHSSILSNGLNDFYNIYHISNISLIQSYIVCNGRLTYDR